jgi:3-deoxy-manno-octulosonate cytidylyltransferase (CMP-KDO synthetase)
MSPTPLEQTEKLEQLRILEHGYKIRASITHYDSMPVDTEKDLQKVRALLRNP